MFPMPRPPTSSFSPLTTLFRSHVHVSSVGQHRLCSIPVLDEVARDAFPHSPTLETDPRLPQHPSHLGQLPGSRHAANGNVVHGITSIVGSTRTSLRREFAM